MTGNTPDDSESPETPDMPLEKRGDGGICQVDQASQALAVQAHNLVAGRLTELIDELFHMVAFRERGCSVLASLDAAKLLCPGMMEINLDDGTQSGEGRCILTAIMDRVC